MRSPNGSDVEQTVRKIVGEVLNEMSDELSSSSGEPPTNGGGTRPSVNRTARSAAEPPPNKPPSNGHDQIPPAVSDAVQAVMRDVSPEQAHSLVSLFEAFGEQGQDEGPHAASAEGTGELASEQQAKSQGQVAARGGIGTVIKLLRRSGPLFRAAVKAAVKGARAFDRWVDSLSSFNPVKWAIEALPQTLLLELIDYLSREKSVGQRTAAAESDPGEPDEDEIEQIVRKVLKEAIAETASA
jgi:hypothetical protein